MKILGCFLLESIAQLIEGIPHSTELVSLVGEREEQALVQLGMSGEKFLRLMQDALVLPLQAGAYRDIGLKHFRPRNQDVDGGQAAERVAGENTKRCSSIVLVDLRDDLVLDEIDEAVAAPAGGIRDAAIVILFARASRSKVARAIGVADADDDQRRDAPLFCQKVDRVADFVDVIRAVGEVKHWKRVFALIVIPRGADKDVTIFIEGAGMQSEA